MSQSGIRRLFTLLTLLLLHSGAPLFAQAELSAPDSEALIKKLQAHRAKTPAMSAEFIEEKTSHLLNKLIQSEGTLAFQAPNKFRREIQGTNPSTTVCDGTQLWIYYPSFKEVELFGLGQQAQFDDAIAALTAGLNFENIAHFYSCRIFRDGAGYRFVLTPRTAGVKRMIIEATVWLDSNFQIQKSEALLPKGDRVRTRYENQRSAPIPAARFEFTPPPDVHVSHPLGQ